MGTPEVEVRRSKQRRRTIAARLEGNRVIVMIPSSLSKAQEKLEVERIVKRLLSRTERAKRSTDVDLMKRAKQLSDTYLGGLAKPDSVRWVSNQRSRWGSCTPGERTIRLSDRLHDMPRWVVDYVLVHELAHLIEAGHTDEFWAWVSNYPQAEKAKGYLEGYSAGARLEPDGEDDSDIG
ncbi:M48 family metallopeptidase [Nocardioides jejuensis]|uniref:M48 family peptidase n=1 Tax=Nocardioides jejuensis TaxID=2502782 RepID=A0A4R1CIR3_9ACTN|nr:M48 family metallopeptidase [Nocardioides jejuensis]TCJ31230.1 M48 family peptidase [Nocardioides jejuensis]